MNEFKFLNYHTVYKCTGDVDHEMGSDSCFHTVTKDDSSAFMDNKYKIRFYDTLDRITEFNDNNFCPFTKKEILRYLRTLQAYRHFEYSLTYEKDNFSNIENDSDDKSDNVYTYWELNLHIEDTFMWHKFILKMIRPLYEFPFNFALRDTMELMKDESYRTYGYFNIYMMCGYIMSASKYISVCDDQFICDIDDGIPLFLKKKELIKRIKNKDDDFDDSYDEEDERPQFNDIVDYKARIENVTGRTFVKYYLENRWLDTDKTRSYDEYWQSEDLKEERFDIYKQLIKYFLPE